MPVFTALHGMKPRYSDEKAARLSVCSSVRLSVKRMYYDNAEERSVQIFLHHTKDHLA